MSRTWQLQEAKNKLSEVVDQAIAEGPQVITRRGEEVAIVIKLGGQTSQANVTLAIK